MHWEASESGGVRLESLTYAVVRLESRTYRLTYVWRDVVGKGRQAGKPDLRVVKRAYQRHLPHLVPEGFPIFLTWNLKGAMPAEIIKRLRCQREQLQRQPRRSDELDADRKIRHAKILFAMADRWLDQATTGPLHLKDPRAAEIVEDSILFGVPERYALFAWCVMANHVHVLLTPRGELENVTQAVKGYTAHQINGVQGARGRVFWQDESYDHWARDDEEVVRIIHYIENNPVAAGLCKQPGDRPWSSARFRPAWPVGQAFQPDMQQRACSP